MRYVILIHSDPRPWGHPTIDFTSAGRAIPDEERQSMGKEFDAFLAEISASGELKEAEALAEPGSASLLRWRDGAPLVTEGPYAEAAEHLAGFFLIDVADRARAEEIARRFAGPGDTVELRPAYVWPEEG
jgi:hypothetical protein